MCGWLSLELSYEAVGVHTVAERQDRPLAPEGPTNLLVAPTTLVKTGVQEYDHCVAVSERSFDDSSPFQARLNRIVCDEGFYPVYRQSVPDLTNYMLVLGKVRTE